MHLSCFCTRPTGDLLVTRSWFGCFGRSQRLVLPNPLRGSVCVPYAPAETGWSRRWRSLPGSTVFSFALELPGESVQVVDARPQKCKESLPESRVQVPKQKSSVCSEDQKAEPRSTSLANLATALQSPRSRKESTCPSEATQTEAASSAQSHKETAGGRKGRLPNEQGTVSGQFYLKKKGKETETAFAVCSFMKFSVIKVYGLSLESIK